MKRQCKKIFSFALAMVLGISAVSCGDTAQAAKKPKLSKKSLTVSVGKAKTLKVSNAAKKVKWTVKSGKKCVTLTKKKKASVVINGKKAGKATVQAAVGAKKLRCKVTVKKAAAVKKTEPTVSPSLAPTASPSSAPTASPVATAGVPQSTAAPTGSPAVVPTETPEPVETEEPPIEGEFRYEGLDRAWIAENIDPEKPVVAMSFDDGPGSYNNFVDYGMQIQQALKDAGAHATFFYIGAHIARGGESEEEVRQAVANGFEVANHSYDSQGLNSAKEDVVREKIDKTNEILKEITGYSEFLFRAPNVAYSETMFSVIDAPFIDVSCWSNDYQDSVDKDKIVENVKKAKDGDIINMHSVHEKTAQAVPEILEYFKEQGIQVVSVSELFAIRGVKLMKGEKYFKCE